MKIVFFSANLTIKRFLIFITRAVASKSNTLTHTPWTAHCECSSGLGSLTGAITACFQPIFGQTQFFYNEIICNNFIWQAQGLCILILPSTYFIPLLKEVQPAIIFF
ncbi:hypothetical protein [Dyadobacter luticola]|uniref:hypothetical protein n=1 Tax=Dyadobacter luticola TaxID=1979387 RepID=UPI00197AE025|nr:hypothetical protein [Dyadobacter luticola]